MFCYVLFCESLKSLYLGGRHLTDGDFNFILNYHIAQAPTAQTQWRVHMTARKSLCWLQSSAWTNYVFVGLSVCFRRSCFVLFCFSSHLVGPYDGFELFVLDPVFRLDKPPLFLVLFCFVSRSTHYRCERRSSARSSGLGAHSPGRGAYHR